MKINKKILRPPLKCWDIYSMHLLQQAQHFNKQAEISILEEFKKKYGWSIDVEKTLKDNNFDAIVLTDFNQDIYWVNKGFTKMTGYPANYAKGKKPNFLQGKSSSESKRKSFREHLKKGHRFKEEILNYKKDGKPYNCEIDVYVLHDSNNTISHYLALEKEVKAS